jgi:cysteinyl-tRNA synthetase
LKKRIEDTQKSSLPDKEFEREIMEALTDDLNISKALSVIDAMIADANDVLDKNPKDNNLKAIFASNIKLINSILGIGEQEALKYFQLGVSEDEKKQIESLIEERLKARSEKKFAKADLIREELAKKGVSLMDSADGTKWEKIDI